MWPIQFFVLLAAAGGVLSRTTGPPPDTQSVCVDISPAQANHGQAQVGNGGYVIATDAALNTNAGVYNYTAGRTYYVQVRNVNSMVSLRGFLVRAEDPSGTPVGEFRPTNQNQQLISCSMRGEIPMETTIGHRNSPGDLNWQTFNWTAPSASDGFVNFMFAVVRVRQMYYANQNAAQIASGLGAPPQVLGDSTTPPPSQPQSTGAQSTGPPGTQSSVTKQAPFSLTAPDRDPNDYRITLRSPVDCTPSECDVFVGIDTNEVDREWLDIYMEANAQTWVALGFSRSNDMYEADVIGCNINPNTGMVEVLDTWNPTSSRTNREEDSQDVGLFPGASFTNNRITCSFARKIAGTNVGVDDLSLNEPYFLMFGSSSSPGRTTSFSAHPSTGSGIPMRPGVMVNPLTGRMAVGGVASTDSGIAPLAKYSIQLLIASIAILL